MKNGKISLIFHGYEISSLGNIRNKTTLNI